MSLDLSTLLPHSLIHLAKVGNTSLLPMSEQIIITAAEQNIEKGQTLPLNKRNAYALFMQSKLTEIFERLQCLELQNFSSTHLLQIGKESTDRLKISAAQFFQNKEVYTANQALVEGEMTHLDAVIQDFKSTSPSRLFTPSLVSHIKVEQSKRKEGESTLVPCYAQAKIGSKTYFTQHKDSEARRQVFATIAIQADLVNCGAFKPNSINIQCKHKIALDTYALNLQPTDQRDK